MEPLFENTLESFQKAVGGYIETFTFVTDACLVMNEEARLLGLPKNFTFLGTDIYGDVICVGVKGDEFASLKAAAVPFLMKQFKEEKK